MISLRTLYCEQICQTTVGKVTAQRLNAHELAAKFIFKYMMGISHNFVAHVKIYFLPDTLGYTGNFLASEKNKTDSPPPPDCDISMMQVKMGKCKENL